MCTSDVVTGDGLHPSKVNHVGSDESVGCGWPLNSTLKVNSVYRPQLPVTRPQVRLLLLIKGRSALLPLEDGARPKVSL